MPRYPNYPGVGKRLKDLLIAAGYRHPLNQDEPDPARFLREHRHFDPRSFYPWLKGRTPTGENLERLVKDLGTTKAWLLLGEGPKRVAVVLLALLATLGVCFADPPRAVANQVDGLRLPGSESRNRWRWFARAALALA